MDPTTLSALPAPLRAFAAAATDLLERDLAEPALLDAIAGHMRELVADGSWIPEDKARVRPGGYAQRLLYRDPAGRLSVVCFVWDAGQATPVHDHGTWGVIGVVRGGELSQTYRLAGGRYVPHGPLVWIGEGEVCPISTADNVHQVMNAFQDSVSISIHAYGGDIGRIERRVFDQDGEARPFISGYDD